MTQQELPKNLHKMFYNKIDRDRVYTCEANPIRHPFYQLLVDFITKWNLKDKRCLEIGSSKGLFQDLVHDYIGVDVASQLSQYYHKKFFVASGAYLPFSDGSFEGIFTYTTHEHIPELEAALDEIIRVLKPGACCLFAPAWHTRSWFAKGYQVRSYSELNLIQKFIKLTIPLRDFFLIRWPIILCRRLFRLCAYLINGQRPGPLKYKKLEPNYEVFWQSDSDACNSIDPFDIIVWFKSRGFICHGYDSWFKILLVRKYALELQKEIV